jgi:hypothetical protein
MTRTVSHLDNRNELKHPTVPSSISFINRPRHPRSAHFPPSLLRTLLIFQGTDNADAVLSVEVKCVHAFGMYYFGSEREPSSLVLFCCQTDVFSGSEIYVGCSNGEILLFALQANGPDQVRSRHCTRSSSHRSDSTQPETYTLVSRQMLPTGKAVDEIVLTPSISKALVLSGKNIRS